MTSSLTVGYQNDILLNFRWLLTSIEILISDNFCVFALLSACVHLS